MANFTIPYTTPANYTYDDTKITVENGVAKLKNLTPANETFYANYNSNINGSRGLGVLTATAVGGASVSDGKLDLSYNDKRYVNYDANLNADSQQVGCIRFKIIPAYSNAPTTDRWFFCVCKAHNDIKNTIQLRHSQSGAYLRLHVYDKDGNFIVEHLCGQFLPVAGTEYEIEFNWDFTTGATRLFINGVQNGSTCVSTCLRDSNIGLLRIGSDYDAGNSTYSQFKIDDFQVFSTVQHTANYTPEAVSETPYSDDSPTIYKTLGDSIANIEEFIAFAETLGSENEGNIRYQLSDDGIVWLYWNGSIWTTAGVGDYNTEAECEAHMLDFDATADKIYVKAFLISDGNQKVELDENQVGYVINTAPSVYAGLNKTAIYNTAIIPFSDCLFSDAEGNITKAEWKEEGGVYAEISQGAYTTLLEAVQAFSYTPTHSGNKTLYLKVTDSYDAYAEDTMVVNVNKVTVTINIQDSVGNNIPNVTWDAGDSSESSTQSSPFSFTYDIGSWTAVLTKNHYNTLSQSVSPSISTTSLTFTMSREDRIDDIVVNLNIPEFFTLGDTFTIDGMLNTDLTGYKIRCEIYDDYNRFVKLATSNSGGSDSEIEIINASTGEFIITCAKDLTDNFSRNVTIEIEVENASGQVRTIFKKKFKFLSENLTWTDPS